MLGLSDDERTELRDSARKLLTDRSASVRVRALLDDDLGHDPSLWSSMAELGWLAIRIPEAYGGLGGTYGDHAVVLHELGRQLTPSPLLATYVAAEALSGATNASLPASILPRIASGESTATVAVTSSAGSCEPSQLSIRCRPMGSSVRLDGGSRFVLDAHVSDHIIVAARDDAGGVTLALVDSAAPGVSIKIEPVYDRTRRLACVTLDDVTVEHDHLLHDPGTGIEHLRRALSIGAIASICDALGAAERILEIANQYAKERFQFNRPIGSFQAVKHHLANMFTDVEASRAAVSLALDALDRGDDVHRAAAIAKSFASAACSRVTHLAVQVHGGIGFTWEHDAHLFLKRTMLDEMLFGSVKWHRQRLAAMVLDQPQTA